MKNEHSSDGIAEDLIRSFVQIGSAEMHAKTLWEKRVSELENGLVDVESDAGLDAQLMRIASAAEEMKELAAMRREDMLYLYKLYGEQGDKEQWCMVKHLGIAMMTAFEAWQASDDDVALSEMALRKNRAFIRVLSQFLGVEVTECASCFADILKGEMNSGN